MSFIGLNRIQTIDWHTRKATKMSRLFLAVTALLRRRLAGATLRLLTRVLAQDEQIDCGFTTATESSVTY